MQALALLIRVISRFNIILGHLFFLVSLGIVLVCFTVVVLRYAFPPVLSGSRISTSGSTP